MKTYNISGIQYRHVPCSAKRAEDFQKQYAIVDKQADAGEYTPMAVLAKSIVERVKADSTLPEPDWAGDVPMTTIREILADFFLLFNPKFGSSLIFLNELNPDEIRTAASTRCAGQPTGEKSKASTT